MASKVDIVNAALNKIGASRILAFTDDTPEGRLANSSYNDLRDEVLRDHPWNFAIRRVALAANATAPIYEYSNSFDLPDEPNYCLRVLSVENPNDRSWKIEGRAIVTNLEAPLNIKYIKRVIDTGLMDFAFTNALAARLAWEWAEDLTGSTSKGKMLFEEYTSHITGAKSVDGQEGTPDSIQSNEWDDAREGGAVRGLGDHPGEGTAW